MPPLLSVNQPRELKARKKTTITNTTETAITDAGGVGIYCELYGLIIANTSATGVTVTIRDKTSTGVQTLIYVPPTETRGFMLPSADGMPQLEPNQAWTAQLSGSVTSIEITTLIKEVV